MISEIYLDLITKKWHIVKISGVLQIKRSDNLFFITLYWVVVIKNLEEISFNFHWERINYNAETDKNDFLL